MLPAAFEAMVRAGIADGGLAFTNGKDATEVVIPQYAEGFDRLMADATEFDYSELVWTDAEAIELAAALSYAHSRGGLRRVRKINLAVNKIGDAGVLALAGVVRSGAMPMLKEKGLQLRFNPASKEAHAEVRAAFAARAAAQQCQ